jgi:hypothetical protein
LGLRIFRLESVSEFAPKHHAHGYGLWKPQKFNTNGSQPLRGSKKSRTLSSREISNSGKVVPCGLLFHHAVLTIFQNCIAHQAFTITINNVPVTNILIIDVNVIVFFFFILILISFIILTLEL